MADFRALCAELLSALESEGYAHWVDGPDEDDLCLRARAALAEEPAVPAPPADGEVAELVAWLRKIGPCNSEWTPVTAHALPTPSAEESR